VVNLQQAMLDRLHEASLKAERDRSRHSQGIIPMSKEDSFAVLHMIRHNTPSPRPRFHITPMSSTLGSIAQQIIAQPAPKKSPFERYLRR